MAIETMTGAQAIWAALVREGVTEVFGYPGGAILPAYDAMLGFPVHHVLVRQTGRDAHGGRLRARERARSVSRLRRRAPARPTWSPAFATAMLDSVPIVCITGQVGSRLIGSDAFQETDITGITLPITKHNYLVTRAEDVAPTIREAFAVARSGRPRPPCSWTSPRTPRRARATSTGTRPNAPHRSDGRRAAGRRHGG